MILNSGDTLTTSGTTAGFSAILINETSDVFSITTEITDLIPYQVPSGKKLVILNYVGGEIMLEGSFVFADQWSSGLPIIVPAGISIETQNNFNGVRFNGYLVDEDYFSDCGGGGSSGGTSLTELGTQLIEKFNKTDTEVKKVTSEFLKWLEENQRKSKL